MRALARIVGRLIAVAFGYLVASLAAGLALVAVVAGPLIFETAGERLPDILPPMLYMAGVFAMFIVALAAAPFLLVVVIAEVFAIRNPFYYIFTGGLIGAVGHGGFAGPSEANALPPGAPEELVSLMVAGFAAGLVYWALVGRRAGPFVGREV